ncbi:MAG: DUF3108 domain-containing protein [Bacteroidota bacterium]
MKRLTAISLFVLFTALQSKGQQASECKTTNTTFTAGESVCYEVSYTWFLIWTDVGEACFTVDSDNRFGKTLLHLRATGESYPFYDWFFKVRDLYESWVDPVTLTPRYYNRNIFEGGFTKENEYWFNQPGDSVKIRVRRKGGPNRFVSIKSPGCLFDVVTSIYYSRCLNFSGIKPGTVFPINVLMDEEIFNVKYRFLGKDVRKISGIGKVPCLKFQVDLVAGDIFSSNQKLMVWVTDDFNKLPVFIESPIRVGSIQAQIKSYKGLRYKIQTVN